MNHIDIERTAFRSRMLGGIRSGDGGAEVELAGWVHRRRDLGGLVFLDLRDRSGLLQVSLGPDWTDAASLDGCPFRRVRDENLENNTKPSITPALSATQSPKLASRPGKKL